MDRHLSIATRHSLLTRLKDWEDQDGWHQFFETYWRLIYNYAMKAGLTEGEAQEVVQETILAIAKHLKELRYDRNSGSFKQWLLKVTRWRVVDQFRKRGELWTEKPHRADDSETATIERVADPESLMIDQHWERDWQENIMEAALERVRKRIPVKHFQAFDLYVTRQWPVSKVARTVGMNMGQVYLIKLRVSKQVKAEIAKLETNLI
jgi:RNA polymerase sigma factor (sigma-70 family)